MAPDIHQHASLPFPKSLPEFQRLFPDDAACAAYLERIRWRDGFVCPQCKAKGEPVPISLRAPASCAAGSAARNFASRPAPSCRTATRRRRPGSGPPTSSASLTPGMSAVQFQRQLGLTRYETAFQILHKLRAGMVRPERDQIGAAGNHVEVDETWVGGKTRGEGQGRPRSDARHRRRGGPPERGAERRGGQETPAPWWALRRAAPPRGRPRPQRR